MQVLTIDALPQRMPALIEQRASEQRNARRVATLLIALTVAGTALGFWA